MDTKHTPGPWIFYVDGPTVDPEWNIVTIANRLRVLASVHIEQGNGTDIANARLLVAAPDMLAALQLALPWVSMPLDAEDMSASAVAHRAILAAISKATA